MSQIISILLMLGYASNFVPPIRTFYTVENDFNFVNHTCDEMASVCYPTIAPSSVRLYTSNVIQGWENNLMMTTLKAGTRACGTFPLREPLT